MLFVVLFFSVFALVQSEQSNTEIEDFKDEVLAKMQLMAQQYDVEIKQLKEKTTEQQQQIQHLQQQYIQAFSCYGKSATCEIVERVTSLEEDMVVVQDEIEDMADDMDYMTDEIEEIEDDMIFMETDINIVQSDITDIITDVEDNENSIAGLRETDYHMYEKMEVMEGTITRLQRADYLLNEEIEEIKEAVPSPGQACLSSPCENSGTCIDVNADIFICMCRDGYFGITCGQTYYDAIFMASLSAVTDESIVVFDDDRINPGRHYNPGTGKYTVPYDGVYQFNILLQDYDDTEIIFSIYVDGVFTHHDGNYDAPYRYTTVVMDLTQGQEVWVNSNGSTLYGDELLRTYFSGTLVHAH